MNEPILNQGVLDDMLNQNQNTLGLDVSLPFSSQNSSSSELTSSELTSEEIIVPNIETNITVEQQILTEVLQINHNLNVIVNGVVPVIGATVVVIWLCRWFHKRFFDRA